MTDLRGKVALVTGGASGLGHGIAMRLRRDGARVFISDVQQELGRSVSEASDLEFLHHDVASELAWSEVVSQIEAVGGRLDILVNNAGILGPSDAVSPEDQTLESWRQVFAVNVEGVFLGCRAALPAMRRTGSGSIVNISSIAGLIATPYNTAYGCSKAAVRQLTQSVAQHCAQVGLKVRCNSVHPGNVRTPLWDRGAEERATRKGVSLESEVELGRRLAPLGEFVQPADVAAAVSFLCSDESSQMTGAMMVVDGGSVYCSSFHMGLS